MLGWKLTEGFRCIQLPAAAGNYPHETAESEPKIAGWTNQNNVWMRQYSKLDWGHVNSIFTLDIPNNSLAPKIAFADLDMWDSLCSDEGVGNEWVI